MKNQLLTPFTGNLNTIPFSKIHIDDFKPAILEAIKQAKLEIEDIKSNTAKPTFENTIAAYECSGRLLGDISGIFFNLNSSKTSDEMQALAQELSPLLTDYSNEIQLDELLFKRIKSAYEATNSNYLDAESAYLMEKIFKGFVRNGANLPVKKKEQLKKINTKLSKLSLVFSENVLKDSNQYELWLDKEADLDGLPESDKDAAKMMAKAKGKPNMWLVNLDYPSYLPFMKYATNSALRKELFMAFGSRGCNANDFNNENIIQEIVSNRHEKAVLLGYASHADFILAERMAKTPEHVYELWNELLKAAMPLAKKEIEEVQAMADEIGGPSPLQRWDFSYYAEKLKNKKFAINDELLKPYFKLENVISGAFKTAEKLFRLNFVERNDIEKYHEDVRTYEVLNSEGNHIAILYADFFPRPSKRSGAWMTSYRGQNKYDGKNQRPLISIVCNFTKPTETSPSLLTFGEVTTLFHEFGHALHGMLANGHYESLSGTSVFWDFVELPSQLMENWCYEPECLELFAHHYQTGEVIPQNLVQKIKDSINFLSAYQTVRQVSLGQLDMAWHTNSEYPKSSIFDFEKAVGKDTELYPPIEGIATSSAFSHIFSGGYSAGYYSYKWAEVLEADAFELFKSKGIFNKEIADRFMNNILSKGGSQDPMELYIKFRGQAPTSKALLKKSGLAS
ncbi:M3 family metallopeptidase [Crocinitomix sp.]|nr:M3 family metallopeptidase [Crocinitomix sp.]